MYKTAAKKSSSLNFRSVTASYQIKHLPIKRGFDLLFSASVLILGFPIYLIISLGILACSFGPIFYIQDRVGRGGKIIRCYKFRTMCTNADERLQNILKENKKLAQEYNTYRKLKDDPRIFSFGRFLRKTSLDELPQFWNVLKGDLSVVGPRPAMACEVQKFYKDKTNKILSIRPGITGIWQTSGRNHLSFSDRVKLDAQYVENQSFLNDLKLIGKTIPLFFFSKGAY